MNTAQELLRKKHDFTLATGNAIYAEYEVIEFAEQYLYAKLHEIGTQITKKSFEVYNPLRKNVVELPDIVSIFDLNGVDIIEKIDF